YTAKGTASVFVPIGSALAAGKAFDFRADIMLLIGLLLLFFTTFLGPTVLGIARSRNARTVLFIVAAVFIVYGLVLTVTNVWTPFAAKFKLPNVGWFGVFAVAVVFDWASALLAQFVLKPLRARYLAKQPAAAQAVAAPAAAAS
ncbi:MAG TPA: hypothetical protein VMV04_06895, partial [Thermodesulfobacteriota bacterium]|nr:hypothetical protein [Thermodesulfobacteriota bacterium]